MKTFKRIIAVLMAVLMIASLAACGESTPPTIIGKWGHNLSLKTVMGATITAASLQSMGDMQKEAYEKYVNAFDGCEVLVVMEFKEDGTVTGSMDKDSIKNALEKAKQPLIDILPEFVAAMSNMTVEQYKAQLEASGMTIEDMVDQTINGLSADTATSGSTGTYRLEGDKLSLKTDDTSTETNMTITLSADEFRITDIEGDGSEGFAMVKKEMLPMVFTRIK